ncbi:hypothetical protein [Streptomyces sp. NPDC004050]
MSSGHTCGRSTMATGNEVVCGGGVVDPDHVWRAAGPWRIGP